MIRTILVCALVIACSLCYTINTPHAAESLRIQEINECRDDEIVTWGDGRDRPASRALLEFTYNPKNSPEWFSADQVLTMVTKASESWAQCGVRTKMIPWNSALEKQSVIIVVKWDEKESGGNIGLANLTRRTLALSPGVFRLLRSRNPRHDARETLQMVISHEIGHFFGLMAHSKRCVDVLSYYDNGKGEACVSRDPLWRQRMVEYRSTLPTACDIKRCRKANGFPAL